MRLKEEQLRREEEKVCCVVQAAYFHTPMMLFSHQLREIELRVQREINEKRQELLAKEESLRYVHVVITRQAIVNTRVSPQ